jgi:hypothetical protein
VFFTEVQPDFAGANLKFATAKVVFFFKTTKKKRIFLLKTPKFSVFIALFGLFHVSL